MAEVQMDTVSQDDISKILYGTTDSVIIPDKDETQKDEQSQEGFKQTLNTDFEWNELKEEKDSKSDTKDTDDKKVEDTTDKSKDEIKDEIKDDKDGGEQGSKTELPADLIGSINALIEEGVLTGYEDGDITSLEEARELIKLNIDNVKNSSKEDLKKEIFESYSPSIQAILQYAENGGTDIAPLLSAISKVEEAQQYDLTTEEGQIQVVSDYLTMEGWSKKDVKEEIEVYKDVNSLERKAKFYSEKLHKMKQDELQQVLEQEERNRAQQEEAKRAYLSTIKTTLEKETIGDLKLQKADKAVLWDSLTNIKYTTWSGQPTNGFFKKLESIQAGKEADYDHFMEIVYLTVNRDKFKEKIREEIRTEEAARVGRKLKIQESKKSTAVETFSESGKKITKQGFKNPWL